MAVDHTIIFPMRVDYTPVFREVYKLIDRVRNQSDLAIRNHKATTTLQKLDAPEAPVVKSKTLGRHIDVVA